MNSKKYGKVVGYNGLSGTIKGVDGKKYLLLDKNLIDKNVEVYDNVMFDAEYYKTVEAEINLARFVKVLKKDIKRTK